MYGIWMALAAISFPAANSWDAALKHHKTTWEKLRQLHGRVVMQGNGAQTLNQMEIWWDEGKGRVIQRTPSKTPGEQENIIITSFDNNGRSRSINGWDPEKPLRPLRERILRGHYSPGHGAIGKMRTPGGRPHVWFVMGIDLMPGWSLEEVSTVSKIVAVSEDERPETYLIEECSIPFLEGIKFSLSPQQGYLIERVVLPNGTVATVDEFHNVNGVPFPFLVTRRNNNNVTTTHVVECQVNEPIAAELLKLTFPEGANVDEPESEKFHIWGVGAPVQTFASDEERYRYQIDQIRTLQRGHQIDQPEPAGLDWLFWTNAVLIGIIASLALLKRYVLRKKNITNKYLEDMSKNV